jgi:hypothetical protein
MRTVFAILGVFICSSGGACDMAEVGSLSNELGPCTVGEQTTPGTCDVHVEACTDDCPSDPDGTPTNAYPTLEAAHAALTTPFAENWVIYVHDGTYWQASVAWTKTDPAYTVEIRPYGNDKPVFDGRSSASDPTGIARFFSLAACGPTNLTLRGLTIQHYYMHGATIVNGLSGCPSNAGNNTIINNVFQYIGSGQDPGCSHHGYSALGINTSEFNTIAGNQFVHLENVSETQLDCEGNPDEAEFDLLHAVYLAYGASNNTVRDNFVDLCTGAAFKVRDGSNDNTFRRNYVNRSGSDHVVNTWSKAGECPSHGTQFLDNVVTFPYPRYPDPAKVRRLEFCSVPSPSCSSTPIYDPCSNGNHVAFTHSGNFLYEFEPESEVVRAIASANTTGGALQEVYVALEYRNVVPDPQPPFTKIVSTGRSPWLSELVYYSHTRTVTAMTGGNFDGAGSPELVTAFNESGTTKVYRGSGASVLPGITGATDLGLVYQDSDWDVTALASGDTDANGSDELFTGLVRPCCIKIYRGNGTTSLTAYGNLLPTTGETPVALAFANFDGTGAPELISALTTTTATRIVRGTGVGTSGATNLGELYPPNTWWQVRSLAGQDAERDGNAEIQTGFHGTGLTRIYRGDGSTSATTAILYESSTGYWTVPALARRTASTTDHLVSGFQASDANETQIWSGDGVTSAGNVAEHYKSIFNSAIDSEDVPDRVCVRPPPVCD